MQLRSTEEKTVSPNEGRPVSEFVNEEISVLYTSKTVFPFDLFPDVVTIERKAVNFVQKHFFLTKRVVSVPYTEVHAVEADTSIFFGQLRVIDIRYNQEPIVVDRLWREDALKLRRIINGLMIIDQQKLDTKGMSDQDLVQHAERIGSSHTD